jgi:hypothetical protein
MTNKIKEQPSKELLELLEKVHVSISSLSFTEGRFKEGILFYNSIVKSYRGYSISIEGRPVNSNGYDPCEIILITFCKKDMTYTLKFFLRENGLESFIDIKGCKTKDFTHVYNMLDSVINKLNLDSD